MPMVAWNKITTPKMQGGLGLRDLSKLNLAFNLKCLWKLASNSNALWVQVASAKYLKDESLWWSTRRARCTSLWKSIMDARQLIQHHTVWQLGDGKQCRVFGQPWHNFWHQVKPSSPRQESLYVSELVNDMGGWNNEKLIQELGFATALYISISISPPQVHPARKDRLVFSYAKNGQFTLRKAYNLLTPSLSSPRFPQSLMKAIWHTSGLMPRIRLFLWKVMHNSLPLGDIIGRRISNAPKPCALCDGDHAETIQHALFKCPWARSLWMASTLGLRTDDLTDNVPNMLMDIFEGVEENRARLVANHLWALWKLRCKEVYEGKKTTPQQFIALAASYDRMEITAGLTFGAGAENIPEQVQAESVMCVVDGSFLLPNSGGWAYIFTNKDGIMHEYGLQDGTVSSPLHAEIMAMQLALVSASKRGISSCVFYTDCASLNLVINNFLQADQLDWRVYQELINVIYLFKGNPGFRCTHVPRDQLALVDNLARFARENRITYEGFTFPFFKH